MLVMSAVLEYPRKHPGQGVERVSLPQVRIEVDGIFPGG
jgi:hypothetical protein